MNKLQILHFSPLVKWSVATCLIVLMATACTKDGDISKVTTFSATDEALLETRSGLPTGMYGVSSIDFGAPLDDLSPIGDIVGDAKVVSIGESEHGTHGFGRARAQVIRYLIEEKGFRAIAYESLWTAPERITNRYIHGELTLQQGLNGLIYATWKTPTTAELLQWLREWNSQHPDDDVVVFGFDLNSGIVPARSLRDSIRVLLDAGVFTAAEQQEFFEAIANCPGSKYDTSAEFLADPEELSYIVYQALFPESRYLACNDAMELLTTKLIDKFEGDAQTIIRAAIRSLQGWNGFVFYWLRDRQPAQNARDAGMADLFELFQNSYSLLEGRKIITVSHNGHHMRRSDEATEFVGFKYKSMGTHIADRLGADYVPIGFFARKLMFTIYNNSIPPTAQSPWTVVLNSPEALEQVIYNDHMVSSGFDYAILDLSQATASNSVFMPGQDYEFGLLNLWFKSEPVKHFDGVFFLKESILDEE